MIDLNVKFAGVSFKNPIVATAGPPTRSEYGLKKCIEAGVGGICTKSISYNPPQPRPSIWFLDKYGKPSNLVNIGPGFWTPEQGVKYLKEIKPLAKKEDVVLVANLDMGVFKEKESKELGEKMEDAGADMIEAAAPSDIVMLSEKEADSWFEEYPTRIIKTLKEAVSIPVFLKMGLEGYSHLGLTKKIEDAGAYAHSLNILGFSPNIDIDTGKPVVLGLPRYSGCALEGLCCYATYMIASNAKLPLMSSGGISTSRDAIECLMCGATLVGVCTAAVYRGFKVYTEMVNGLRGFLERKAHDKVQDIMGVAMPHIKNLEELRKFVLERLVPRGSLSMIVDPSKCSGCGKCSACVFGAIVMGSGLPKIDLDLCERCGACATICPSDAITVRKMDTEIKRGN